MENVEANMNMLFNKYGHVLETDEFGEGTIFFTEFFVSIEARLNLLHSPGAPKPRVHIRVIDNIGVSAAVVLYKSEYYIGVFMGVVYALDNVFLRMLSTETVLPDKGNVELEVAPEKVYELRIANIERIIDAMGKIPLPVDVSRYEIADFMKNLVLQFIVFHEYGHALLGHCNFFSGIQGLDPLIENSMTKEEKASLALFKQVCEHDADTYATIEAMKNLERHCAGKNSHIKKMIPSIEEAVRLWTLAVYSYWKLSGGPIRQPFVLVERSHPPIDARQAIIVKTILTYFAGQYQGSANWKERAIAMSQIAVDACLEAERAFAEVSDQPFIGISMLDDQVKRYLKIIEGELEAVRAAVKPFSFFSPLDHKPTSTTQ
jgi:hypothetical protein